MARSIPAEVAALKRALAQVKKGQRYAHGGSIENATLEFRDGTGTLRGRIGMQADGTLGLIAVDGPPPGAPTAPVITPSIGGLRIVWDGLLADGTPLPADFDHVAVHISTSSGFTPSAATFTGTITRSGDGGVLPVTPLPYQAHYVALTAVNSSGNAGPPSVETTATPLKVDGPDLTAGSVTAAAIQAGAVTADKLEAILQLVTRLVAGDPAGARVELNEDGLRVYNTSGALVIRFDAADGSAVFTGNITGSTINGSLFQTDTSGERITLNEGDQNKILVYSATRTVAELSAQGLALVGSGGAKMVLDPNHAYPNLRLTNAAQTNEAYINVVETTAGAADLGLNTGTFSGSTFSDMRWRTFMGNDFAVIERLRASAASTVIGGRLELRNDRGVVGYMNTTDSTKSNLLGMFEGLAQITKGRLQVFSPASSDPALLVVADAGQTGAMLRLAVGGSEKFAVDKDGNLTVAGVGQRQTKRRTSDGTRTNTNTPSADTQLTFPVDANAVYALDGFLKYSGPGDFQMGWSVPSGTLGEWHGIGNGTTVVSSSASNTIQTDIVSTWGYTVRTESSDVATNRTYGGISTSVFGVQVRALFRVGASAGNIALAWAQGTSGATSTTLHTDSHLRLEKVA
jgi:hypothetical protein